jgi:two-component system, NtrC family, C4-dicarboxylate transport sensor histidine kinase DctB
MFQNLKSSWRTSSHGKAFPKWGPLSSSLVGLFLGIILCVFIYQWTHSRVITESNSRASRQVSAFGLALQNELEKYETLPFVMSLHEDVVSALMAPQDTQKIGDLNQYLVSVQKRASISAAFVMDATGVAIAASNAAEPTSFVGESYAFRPYLRSALQGEMGRFFAIGTTTGEPGYFLAYPVYLPKSGIAVMQGLPIGAVVIKIRLEEFERYWATSDGPVVLLDKNGVSFLGNVQNLKYRTSEPLSSSVLAEIQNSRQYNGRQFRSLALEGYPHYSMQVYVEQPVGKLGWRLRLFTSSMAADDAAFNSALAAGLIFSLAGLISYSMYQRRQHDRVEFAARQALSEAAEELEQRIAARTIDLVAANTELRDRYMQLKQTQQLFRQTQNQLIQAGKLGMLGQMAAGMTHELNQPLTAIQAFSDNAVIFLDRCDYLEVHTNLVHISDACTRMAHLIRQLKTFARKSDGQLEPVDLEQAVQNSALLVGSDYMQRNTVLEINVEQNARVMGDSVRVEQVLINLLRNALDAVDDCPVKHVKLELSVIGKNAQIRIVDTGPGLNPLVRQHLFEPFFTTKPSGEGLGLGLVISWSIVQAMSGQLLADNSPDSGAVFILKLPLCPQPNAVSELNRSKSRGT